MSDLTMPKSSEAVQNLVRHNRRVPVQPLRQRSTSQRRGVDVSESTLGHAQNSETGACMLVTND